MPSRSSRSRSRSPSRRHKKSHKRSRKSSDERSPPASNAVPKKDVPSDENEDKSVYKARLPSVMLPPVFLAKLEAKEEVTVQSPSVEQPSGNTSLCIRSTSSNACLSAESPAKQSTKRRKRRWNGDETEKVFLPNMPTTISAASMTEEQQKIYLRKRLRDLSTAAASSFFSPLSVSVQVQVEELTRRLKMNDFGIPARAEDR